MIPSRDASKLRPWHRAAREPSLIAYRSGASESFAHLCGLSIRASDTPCCSLRISHQSDYLPNLSSEDERTREILVVASSTKQHQSLVLPSRLASCSQHDIISSNSSHPALKTHSRPCSEHSAATWVPSSRERARCRSLGLSGRAAGRDECTG